MFRDAFSEFLDQGEKEPQKDILSEFLDTKKPEAQVEYSEVDGRQIPREVYLRQLERNAALKEEAPIPEGTVMGEWMGQNWRDIKAVPGLVVSGAMKGGSELLETATGLTDLLKGAFDPGNLIALFKQKKLERDIKSGKRNLAKSPLTDEESDLLSYQYEGWLPKIKEKITEPVKVAAKDIVEESGANPLAKAYFSGVGHLAVNLPGIKVATKLLGPKAGMALYNSLKGISKNDLKEAALGAASGAAMGSMDKVLKIVRYRYPRALVEGGAFGTLSAAEQAIAEGKIPDIDENIISSALTGVAFGLGRKGEIEKQKELPIEEKLKRPEDIPEEGQISDIPIEGQISGAVEKVGEIRSKIREERPTPAEIPDMIFEEGAKTPVKEKFDVVETVAKTPTKETAPLKDIIENLERTAVNGKAEIELRRTGTERGDIDLLYDQADRKGWEISDPEVVEDRITIKISGIGKEKEMASTEPPPEMPGEITAPIEGGEMGVSRFRTNTMEKTLPPEVLERAPEQNYQYRVESEKMWQKQAADKVNSDFEGARREILDKPVLDEGSDGAVIGEVLKKHVNDGDWNRAVEFTERVTKKITPVAQALRGLQVIQKLSPEGILMTAQEIYNEARARANRTEGISPKKFDKFVNEKLKSDFKIKDGELIVDRREGKFLSPEFAKKLSEKARKINDMPEGQSKDIEYQKLIKEIKDRIPSSMWEKLETLQTIDMLFSIRTFGRNAFSNATFAAMEGISRNLFGVPFDYLLSKVTGVRTVASGLTGHGEQIAAIKSGVEALKVGAKDIWRGENTRYQEIRDILGPETIEMLKQRGYPVETASKYEIRTDVFKGTSNIPIVKQIGMVLKVMERITGVGLVASDYAFYKRAFTESLLNEMRASKSTVATPEQLFNAHVAGLFQTYQHNSNLARAMQKVKNGLNFQRAFGLGSLVAKFPRTPANLLTIGLIDYSPLGTIRAAAKIYDVIANRGKGKYTQREAALTAGRIPIGGAMWFAGFELFKAGILTLTEKKEKVKDLKSAMGIKNLTINFDAMKRWVASGFNNEAAKYRQGDRIVPYDWAEPFSSVISGGAEFGRIMGEKGDMSAPERIANGIFYSALAAVRAAGEAPFFRGLYKLFGEKDISMGIGEVLKGAPSTFIPQLLLQIRYSLDPKIREMRDPDRNILKEARNMIFNRLPGLSMLLPEQIDITGKPRKGLRTGNEVVDFLNIFVKPWSPDEYRGTPGLEMIHEIYKETGETGVIPPNATRLRKKELKVGKEWIALTPEQKIEYQRRIGTEMSGYLDKLAKNPEFRKMNPERQAKLIKKWLERIGDRIRSEFRRKLKRRTP